jgi:hypothetical protein
VTKSTDYSAGLDLLSQEYRAALDALYSEDEPWHVCQHRVQQLTVEHKQRRAHELKAISAQQEADRLNQMSEG